MQNSKHFLIIYELRAVWLTRATVLQCGRGFALNENGRCTGKFPTFICGRGSFQTKSFPPSPSSPQMKTSVPASPSCAPSTVLSASTPTAAISAGPSGDATRASSPATMALPAWVSGCGQGQGGSGWINRIIGSSQTKWGLLIWFWREGPNIPFTPLCCMPNSFMTSPDSALPPLSPQPRWPTLEARGRLRFASGRAFASGCSYHTSSAQVCCSRHFPPSVLPPMLWRCTETIAILFPQVSLIPTAAVCHLPAPDPPPDYEGTHKCACFPGAV